MTSRSEHRARTRAPAGSPGHVLIIVQNLSVPFDRRVWMECLSLVAAGVRVSVICPQAPGDAAFEVLEGVRIHRYRAAPDAAGVVGFVYECLYAWLRTAWLSLRIYRRMRFDTIQACNPPDTYFALARLYHAVGVRFVYDQHDLCPEIYRSRFARDRGLALRILLWLERCTYRAADRVISTNESYRQVASTRGAVPDTRLTVVRSGPDPQVMRAGPPQPELRNGRAHLCCYLGVMGHQDRVDLLVRVIDVYVHELGRVDCQFAFLGFGDCYEEVRALAHELDLDPYITFTGRAGLEVITAYLSTAALGLSPDPKTPFNDVSTMNKVIEYLAYGLPVVAFDLTETAVSAGDAAVLVPDDDVAAFADAVVSLLDDPERRRAMGDRGRVRVERSLGWPAQRDAYVGVHLDLLDESARVLARAWS